MCDNWRKNRTRMGRNRQQFIEAETIPSSVFLSCCAVLCFTGNMLVLLSLKRYPNLRTPANVILGSLAMSDLLMTFPFSIMTFSMATKKSRGVHTDIQAGISSTLVATASLHIALISIDRFISIRYALRYVSIMTMRRVGKLLAFIWSLAITLVGLVRLFTALLAPKPQYKRILFNRRPRAASCSYQFEPWMIFYKSLTTVLFFFLPLLTMVVSYGYITWTAYIQRKTIRAEVTQSTTAHSKGTTTVFIVVAVYFILNSPYSIVSLLCMSETVQLGRPCRPRPMLALLGVASLASCCNPFIYAYRNRHFKRAFKNILTCK